MAKCLDLYGYNQLVTTWRLEEFLMRCLHDILSSSTSSEDINWVFLRWGYPKLWMVCTCLNMEYYENG